MDQSFSQILMAKRPDLDNELKESQRELLASEKGMEMKRKCLLQETMKKLQMSETMNSLTGLYARQAKRVENIRIYDTSGLKTIENFKSYLKIMEDDQKRVEQVLFETKIAIAKAKTRNQAFDEKKAQMKEQLGRLNKAKDFVRKKLEFYVSGSSKILELRQKIANKKEEKDAVSKLIQGARDKQNDLKDSIEKKTEKLVEIQSEIDKAEATEKDYKEKMKDTTIKLKEQEKITKETTDEKAKWAEKLADHLKQIHELSLKSRELDDEILEAEKIKLEKEASVLDKNEKLNASCASKNEEIDQMDQELEVVNKELNEINEKLKQNPIEELDEKINTAKEKLAKIQEDRDNCRTPNTPKENSPMNSPLTETRVGDWLRDSDFPSGQVSEIDWSLNSEFGGSAFERTPSRDDLENTLSPDHLEKTPSRDDLENTLSPDHLEETSSPNPLRKRPHSSPERPPSSQSSRSTRSSRSSRRSAKVRRMTPQDEFCEVSSTYLGD